MNRFRGGKEIYIGCDHLEELFGGYKNCFIVCDPFIVESGMVKNLTDRLDGFQVPYTIYTDVAPDPDTEMVSRGVEALTAADPDIMVAMGGGAAIDLSKAMKYFARQLGVFEKPIKLAVVPTTSGTGSEVTDFTVITNRAEESKVPIVDPSILPDAAILDPELTKSVPPAITAATGMDALTHAIEALVTPNCSDFSDAAAEKSIKLIRDNLLRCYQNPGDMEARQKMHNAATLAGIAFNNSGLGLNHGMAHTLGAHYHIPHGKACAVLMPYVIAYNAGCYDTETPACHDYARIAHMLHIDSSTVRGSALSLIRTIKSFLGQLDMPSCIKEMGISEDEFRADLEEMVQQALADGTTASNPRHADYEGVKRTFIHAYHGNFNSLML